MSDVTRPHVVVIGGGLTGLAAAYALQTAPVRCTVLERDDRLGGKVKTEYQDGFVLEAGPDSFLLRKPWARDLCHQVGLDSRVAAMGPHGKGSYILLHGKLQQLPEGTMLGVPTRIGPFLSNRLLSWPGKLRAGLDLLLPARKDDAADESVASFITRRMGREVLDRLVEPLLGGIFACDSRELSAKASLPQLLEMERRYGGLLRGMLAQAQSVRNNRGGGGLFGTLQGGLNELVQTVASSLTNAEVRTNCTVVELKRDGGGYRVVLADGTALNADAVLLSTPAPIAADLVTEIAPASARMLGDITSTSVATVALGFRMDDIAHPMRGSGFVVPRSEKRWITACTWVSSKWPHAVPAGKALIRCYLGRADDERWMDRTDEELIGVVRSELEAIMGIRAEPLFSRVWRWVRAMPQYKPGHLERVDKLEAALAVEGPGLFLAGAPYRGVGLPDCIRQGFTTAQEISRYLGLQSAVEETAAARG